MSVVNVGADLDRGVGIIVGRDGCIRAWKYRRLYVGSVDGWCAGGASIVVIVVGDGEAYAVHFSFEWFERGNDADVADCAALGDVVECDGCYCLCSFGSESVEFVAPSLLPVLLARSFNEVVVFQGIAGDWVDDGVG